MRIDEYGRDVVIRRGPIFREFFVGVARVLDGTLPENAIAPLRPLQRARDADEKLATFRPAKPDDVAAVLIDPHGFLILSYPAGYDGNLLRRDLARLIKG